MDGRPIFSSSTSYMRKSTADTTAIKDVIKKHVERSSSSVWLICVFLFVYFLVSCVFTVIHVSIAFMDYATSDLLKAAFDVFMALFGMLTASLGFYSVNTLAVTDARRFFVVLLIFGLIYLVSIIATAAVHFNSLSNYMTDEYGFSLTNSLTTISLGVVIASYVMVSFILKSYNFQKSIQQMMDVQPKTDRPKNLPTILDR